MEVCRVSAIIEARQGLMVALNHLAITYPLKHEFVGEDAFVVDFKAIFIELQLSGTISD